MSAETCARCHATLAASGVCGACMLAGGDDEVLLRGGTLRLGEQLGEGGMGVVFRARDLRLGRDVAVKFLPARVSGVEEFRLRFEREAHALALLNHPNIVGIYDYGSEDGEAYIVMELVHGAPLCTHPPMSPERAVAVVLQVADALAYAHERGVVHRDIKPGNVLVDAAGTVKVSDFGLARMHAEGAQAARGWTLTAPDRGLGSMYYMAPEVLRGAEPSVRMDVYSLGVLLYEAMTGAPPMGDFERLPGTLDSVLRRALSQSPEKRYATMHAFASALRVARASMHTEDGVLPAAERTWLRAVALLYAAATAISGWALLASLTPHALRPDQIGPFDVVLPRPQADGRFVSLARFEIWPTVGALAAFGAALAAWAMTRKHWSQTGQDRPDPERPLGETTPMAAYALVALLIYGVRVLGRHTGHDVVVSYTGFFGPMVALYAMFLLWCGLLEAARRARPLRREAPLLIGFGLVILPVALELVDRVWPLIR